MPVNSQPDDEPVAPATWGKSMNDVNKVSASAGAQWLLDGFATLRKAPLGLGLLGVIYGAIALSVGLAVGNQGLFMALEVVMVLIGPLLMGGFVYAVRSVEEGGPAVPAHLLEGFRNGRAGRLLATLLPNIAALVVCVVLLFLVVGPTALLEMEKAMQQAGAQATPDPALFATLPLGRLMLWFLMVLVVGVVASFFTFVAIPEVMFGPTSAFAAMGRSFRACVRNLPALIVFLVLAFIAIIAIYIVIMVIGLVVKLLAGAVLMQVVTQLLAMAVLMPVLMGAVYSAWRQMLAGSAASPMSAGIEA
jgi:hypothetical protein